MSTATEGRDGPVAQVERRQQRVAGVEVVRRHVNAVDRQEDKDVVVARPHHLFAVAAIPRLQAAAAERRAAGVQLDRWRHLESGVDTDGVDGGHDARRRRRRGRRRQQLHAALALHAAPRRAAAADRQLRDVRIQLDRRLLWQHDGLPAARRHAAALYDVTDQRAAAAAAAVAQLAQQSEHVCACAESRGRTDGATSSVVQLPDSRAGNGEVERRRLHRPPLQGQRLLAKIRNTLVGCEGLQEWLPTRVSTHVDCTNDIQFVLSSNMANGQVAPATNEFRLHY